MKQIEHGLFEIEEPMPCEPKDFHIPRYAMLSTFNRMECEEAAARILSFSQQQGRWVGVSWTRLLEMLEADYKKYERNRSRRLQVYNEMVLYNIAARRYRMLCVLTLGIYALFNAKPIEPKMEEDKEKFPLTLVVTDGPFAVLEGIGGLMEHGWLRRVIGDDKRTVIFFPTPAMINRVLQVQKITPKMH